MSYYVLENVDGYVVGDQICWSIRPVDSLIAVFQKYIVPEHVAMSEMEKEQRRVGIAYMHDVLEALNFAHQRRQEEAAK